MTVLLLSVCRYIGHTAVLSLWTLTLYSAYHLVVHIWGEKLDGVEVAQQHICNNLYAAEQLPFHI